MKFGHPESFLRFFPLGECDANIIQLAESESDVVSCDIHDTFYNVLHLELVFFLDHSNKGKLQQGSVPSPCHHVTGGGDSTPCAGYASVVLRKLLFSSDIHADLQRAVTLVLHASVRLIALRMDTARRGSQEAVAGSMLWVKHIQALK